MVKMLMTNDVSLCEGKKGSVSVITLLQSVEVKGGKRGEEVGGGREPADLQTALKAVIPGSSV